MTEETKLLPCPFCGGKAERIEIEEGDEVVVNIGGSIIECTQCHVSSPVHFERKENLVSSWNTRALSPPEPTEGQVEAHERLRKAYQEMEAMCASYRAAAKIDLSTLDHDSRELALWAAAEAERWLDPRAGSGSSDNFGQRLQAVAGVLALRSMPLQQETKP